MGINGISGPVYRPNSLQQPAANKKNAAASRGQAQLGAAFANLMASKAAASGTPATGKTTTKAPVLGDRYAGQDTFISRLEGLQADGRIGPSGRDLVDRLTDEQMDYLRGKYDVYQTMEPQAMGDFELDLFRDLTEMGIISPEDCLLSAVGGGSIAYWHQNSSGEWTGNTVTLVPGLYMMGDDFDFSDMDIKYHNSTMMQWLQGAMLIDKDNPIADDVTAARIKMYDLLCEIFGEPKEEQSFAAYYNSRPYKLNERRIE